MSNLHPDQAPDPTPPASGDNSENKTPGKQGNPIITGILMLIALPVMILREAARSLYRRTYDNNAGNILVGWVMAILTGIGYAQSQILEHVSLHSWLPLAALFTVLMFYYAYPLAYLAVFRPLVRSSRYLWQRVHESQDSWLTSTLQDAASLLSLGIGALVGASLPATDYTNPLGAILLGIIAGFTTATFLIALLNWGRIRLIAVATGAGAGKLMAAQAGIFLPAAWAEIPLISTVIVAAIWALFIFPLAFALIDHNFAPVARLFSKNYNQAYREEDRELSLPFAHLINIAGALSAAGLMHHLLLFTKAGYGLWLHSLICVVAAFGSYLLLGFRANEQTNKFAGRITTIHVLAWLLVTSTVQLVLTSFANLSTILLACYLLYAVAYPFTYGLFLKLGTSLLRSKLAGQLVIAHEIAWEEFLSLWWRLLQAPTEAYGDKGRFARFLPHLATYFVTWQGFQFTANLAAGHISAAPAVYLVATAGALLTYLLGGKLILALGNTALGLASAIPGTPWLLSTGLLPVALLTQANPLAILICAALWVFFVFPVSYVLARYPLNILVTPFLVPRMDSLHSWSWQQFSGLWDNFRKAYCTVRDMLRPIWTNLVNSWYAAKQQLKEIWEKLTGNHK